MAQLIQMRQRIKTVETIKKITHAMRLIAMAAHGHLKQKRTLLAQYQAHILALFSQVRARNPQWQTKIFDVLGVNRKKLVIFMASQKGLCGNFNAMIFDFFGTEVFALDSNTSIIAVGKNAAEFLEKKYQIKPVLTINSVSAGTCRAAVQQIIAFIKAETPFSSLAVVANFPKSFFMQNPQMVDIIACIAMPTDIQAAAMDYLLEDSSEEVLEYIAEQYVVTALHMIMLESLLAEQAARFISMDNSTRNAENLLETTKLSYNKLRQAKITRELIELTGSRM